MRWNFYSLIFICRAFWFEWSFCFIFLHTIKQKAIGFVGMYLVSEMAKPEVG